MKESRKKKALDYLLNRLDEIDQKYETLSAKSSQWHKAVDKVKRDIRGEDKQGNLSISLATYHNYLGDLRDAVKRTGRKHPALSSKISTKKGYILKVIKDMPEYEDDLRAIAEMPALTIHKGVSSLQKRLDGELKGSKRNDYTDSLKSLLIHHPVVMKLEKRLAEKRLRSQQRDESLELKTKVKKVYNAPAVIQTAISLLYDPSYTARAWALALLTGRRSTEIMYHATFEYINDNIVLFSGQLKKSLGSESSPYPIPVLHDSKEIIKALEAFRNLEPVAVFRTGSGTFENQKDVEYSKLPKRFLNRAINNRCNGVLNERAKKIMDDDAEVFKNTRVIYAEYCKQSDEIRNLKPEWSTMADDAFLKDILGHEQLGEVKHYNQSEVVTEPDSKWLKVPEPKKKKEEDNSEPKELVKQNRRAMAGFADMTKAINDYPDKFVQTPNRRVNIEKVRELHHQLSTWASENPTLEITQTVVTKNKGNTADSGTGTMNLTANRYTFQAWVIVAGNERVNAYNKGKNKA